MNSRAHLVTAAAILGFVGVAFGAFGAHAIHDPTAKAWVQTGASYQMIHVLAALLAVQAPIPARGAALAFLIGAVLFSGSLYAMALGAPRFLGAVTPLGGLGFLAGWLMLALSARRQPQ